MKRSSSFLTALVVVGCNGLSGDDVPEPGVALELRSGLLHLIDVMGTPVMRSWNVVHLLSKLLSPSAEAFRYFILEEAEAYLVAHDTPLLSAGADR